MRVTSLLALATTMLVGSSSVAAWTLKDTYQGDTFFNGFTFFTGSDPTHGTVQYVDQSTAQSSGLISTSGGVVTMKADSTNVTPNGRPSVRITSNNSYNTGLFIMDASHMPVGCGTWPAYWLVGPNWPNSGEIDVIEGVNTQSTNQVTLHTSDGCTVGGTSQTGNFVTTNCYVNAPGQSSNQGCGVSTSDTTSYGTGFNNNGGGVYATQWEANSGIQVWFFPRNKIPSDITSGNPNPNGWGTPLANFGFGSCSSNHFANLQIVFDLTFCGDWAGAVYSQNGCPGTCSDYVINTPSAFQNAYWSVNYVKVYQ
ncbi:beta-1,3-1,4-glucanase [Gongronella butleri]|nr:beta-1,3-1,4-glucanase [Gongronella butleri]